MAMPNKMTILTTYIRTDPVVLNNIKRAIKTQKPTDAYDALTKHDDSIPYPKDIKQVQNIKQNTKKAKTQHNANVADELLNVIAMLNND